MFDKLSRLFRPEAKRPYQLFQIEPSLECNLACVMCPWTELRPERAMMSWEVFSRIAGHLPLAESVDFTGGGEPTLNPHLPEMIRAAKEAGCEAGFSTNGTLLNQELAQALLDLKLDWLSFSVDGATAGTYEAIRQGSDFELVVDHIAGMNELKRAGGSKTPRLMAVFVMMAENYEELPAYVELAHGLGIEQVIAKNLDVILKQEDDTRRLFSHDEQPRQAKLEAVLAEARQRARKLGVGLRLYAAQPQELAMCEQNPLRNLFFNWTGDVSPCITLSYAETRVFNGRQQVVPCLRFGNIKDEPLEQIWQKAAYREFRRPFEVRVRLEREATINALLGNGGGQPAERPKAPDGCQSCYYLYGV